MKIYINEFIVTYNIKNRVRKREMLTALAFFPASLPAFPLPCIHPSKVGIRMYMANSSRKEKTNERQWLVTHGC